MPKESLNSISTAGMAKKLSLADTSGERLNESMLFAVRKIIIVLTVSGDADGSEWTSAKNLLP
jgi:hypothetical protein